MARVRSLRRVRIAARRPERARALAADVRYPFAVEAVESVEAAVRGADLVVTVTSSVEPVLRREWIAAGTHVNAVGSSIASAREIDTAMMAASRLFVDRRESTLAESGDYLFAAREGAIGPDHIQAELGELLVGARPGRRSRDEITLFKSLGLGIEDLAAAEHVYRKALERGAGTRADL
jgi:ornithine cyclodeaminase